MKQFFLRLIVLLTVFLPKQVWAQEPYAVLSGDTISGSVTVTFYYDDQKAARGGMDINNKYINIYQGETSPYGTATTAVIDASFAEYRPTSTACWFMACSSLASINGIENIKTDNVTDMSFMFEGCSSLTSLDLCNFNTENVTDMFGMFKNCSSLTAIYCNDVWSVTSSSNMFLGCTNLVGGNGTVYDASHVDIEYARIDKEGQPGYFTSTPDASGKEAYAALSDEGKTVTFYYDTQKASRSGVVEINNFDHHTVTTAMFDASFADYRPTSTTNWFCECYNLTSITGINYLKTENVTDMLQMFFGCRSLTSLDVSNFKTDNVTSMSSMFNGCSGLTSLDLSGFKTDNVTDMGDMFYGCSNLETIYADGAKWNTDNVHDGSNMFTDCTSLVGGSGTAYDASHTDHEYARIDKPDQPGYLTPKDATGIEKLSTAPSQSEGAWYTLDGRRVETPTKGINIKNGKKVVIK